MKTYQYQILRYRHDAVTGEFINVGVIILLKDDIFLGIKTCRNRLSRASSFFKGMDLPTLNDALKNIENIVEKIQSQQYGLFSPEFDLNLLKESILKFNDGALNLSSVMYAIDIDGFNALNETFELFVDRYQHEKSTESLTPDEAWVKQFKVYFQKYHIESKLKQKYVKTKNDTFEFNRSYKNDIWHFYEPLPLFFKEEYTVKEKIYRWAGRIKELSTSTERVQLNFLVHRPNEYIHLDEFVKEYLNNDFDNLKVSVFMEEEASDAAKELKRIIDLHEDS